MQENKKRTLTIIGSAIMFLLVIIVSYGYITFNADNTNRQVIGTETATIALTYTDCADSNQEDCANISANLEPGDSMSKTFQVENTGTVEAYYSIRFNSLINSFLNEELVYKIEELESGKSILKETAVPYSASEKAESIPIFDKKIASGEKHKYKIIIKFLNTDYDQTANSNASFTIKLGLQMESASHVTLSALGLADSVKEEPTDYNMFNYTFTGYYRDINTGARVKGENIGTTEGVYSMKDDFGISYYFRGSKSLNNIVRFGNYDVDMYYYEVGKSSNGISLTSTGTLEDCLAESTDVNTYCTSQYKYASKGSEMLWRIIRINGDGTLRLLSTSFIGKTNYNIFSDNPKYVGYTYDNSGLNSGVGTDSHIKKYIDRWYLYNFEDNDNLVAEAQFFCDTSGYSYNYLTSQYNFSTLKRLEKNRYGNTNDVNPTLKTSLINQTYGGKYYLKAGLINVDELVISGLDGLMGVDLSGSSVEDKQKNSTYTINLNGSYATMSPGYFTTFASQFYAIAVGYVSSYGIFNLDNVRPVINLTPEAAQSLIGEGSSTNPYRLPA